MRSEDYVDSFEVYVLSVLFYNYIRSQHPLLHNNCLVTPNYCYGILKFILINVFLLYNLLIYVEFQPSLIYTFTLILAFLGVLLYPYRIHIAIFENESIQITAKGCDVV